MAPFVVGRYFEVVETYRRLILTAVIAVIDDEQSQQEVSAILLSFLFMEIYAHCHPYRLKEVAILSMCGQYQVFLTFIGALVIKNNLLGDENNDQVAGSLITLNLGVMILALYFEIMDYRNGAGENKMESAVEMKIKEIRGGRNIEGTSSSISYTGNEPKDRTHVRTNETSTGDDLFGNECRGATFSPIFTTVDQSGSVVDKNPDNDENF